MSIGPIIGFAVAALVIAAAGFFSGFWVIPVAPRVIAVARMAIGAVRGIPLLAALFWAAIAGLAIAEMVIGHGWEAGMALLGGSAFFCVSCRAHTHSKWMKAAAEIGDALAASEARTYDIEFLAVHYRVSRHQADTWLRAYKVVAKSTTIAMKGFVVGVDGASRPVRVLESLGIVTWTRVGQVLPVPAWEAPTGGRQWRLNLLFSERLEPPDKASSEQLGKEGPAEPGKRLFYVAGTWRGMWDPLRKTGYDAGVFEPQSPVRTLEIRVMMPRGLDKGDFSLAPEGPQQDGSSLVFDFSHRKPVWIWTIQNAEARPYVYHVSVTEDGRRKLGWIK